MTKYLILAVLSLPMAASAAEAPPSEASTMPAVVQEPWCADTAIYATESKPCKREITFKTLTSHDRFAAKLAAQP